jgi:hypothetical protein
MNNDQIKRFITQFLKASQIKFYAYEQFSVVAKFPPLQGEG